MGSAEEDAQDARKVFENPEIRTAPGLLEQWHSQPMRLRIIHIGAGATGLCCAYKMERQLSNYELVCYEKNPEVGGTWYDSEFTLCGTIDSAIVLINQTHILDALAMCS